MQGRAGKLLALLRSQQAQPGLMLERAAPAPQPTLTPASRCCTSSASAAAPGTVPSNPGGGAAAEGPGTRAGSLEPDSRWARCSKRSWPLHLTNTGPLLPAEPVGAPSSSSSSGAPPVAAGGAAAAAAGWLCSAFSSASTSSAQLPPAPFCSRESRRRRGQTLIICRGASKRTQERQETLCRAYINTAPAPWPGAGYTPVLACRGLNLHSAPKFMSRLLFFAAWAGLKSMKSRDAAFAECRVHKRVSKS